MDIRALRAFAEVARQGGFTRAAAALHLSQSAVSKLVKGLEEELGVPLLHRDRRRASTTDAGALVLRRAEAILDGVRAVEEELGELAGARRGRLRIGLPPMVSGAFFPRVVADFRRRHPGVALELRETGARRVEALVLARELDLGVTILPTDTAAFDVRPVARELLLAVLPAADPLARRRRLALRELAGRPLVHYRRDFALHDLVLAAFRGVGLAPEVASESSQWDFMAELVASGLGVALLPETICRRLDRRRLASVPVGEPEIPWHVALVRRPDPHLPAAVRAFLDSTSRCLGSPGAGQPGGPKVSW